MLFHCASLKFDGRENMCSVFCGGCIAVNTCTKHFVCRGEGCKVLDWYDVGLNCSGFVVPCCVVVSRKGVRWAGVCYADYAFRCIYTKFCDWGHCA
jgi:hypothetical protein